jgi:hypothetical protein
MSNDKLIKSLQAQFLNLNMANFYYVMARNAKFTAIVHHARSKHRNISGQTVFAHVYALIGEGIKLDHASAHLQV